MFTTVCLVHSIFADRLFVICHTRCMCLAFDILVELNEYEAIVQSLKKKGRHLSWANTYTITVIYFSICVHFQLIQNYSYTMLKIHIYLYICVW